MIEILKKQWFVVLIAVIFIGFAIFAAYDTNKGKLPGKSVGGKDVVASMKGDVNITADDLYKQMESTSIRSLLFTHFQADVINKGVKTTDELKKTAQSYESNMRADAESRAASAKTDAKTLILQQIERFGFTYDQLGDYAMTVAKMEKLRNDYISENFHTLFTPMYEKKSPRIVSHILIKMADAQKPTEEEMKKVKEVEEALKKGDKFEDVAKKYSDDTASKAEGGYLGYMDSDTQFVQSFKDAASKLKKGEISPWIKESNQNYNGWHMIRVEETDKNEIGKNEKVKSALYTAITNFNPEITNKFLWETAKKLDIKYANDDIKQQILDIMNVKE